ncbi:MAG: lipopolysaccharide heptosyltransferase II [Candidatus Omnitrophica bacterium]|nr:lipopolysaccharide heptosyltransferase II [Candidatus Omnitrophota bacterium]
MNRILVVLPNWFGETLFVTPFLKALRERHPEAWIATLGWPQCREILLQNPHVNALLEYDERGRHRSVWGKRRLIASLRAEAFDAAFMLRKSLSRSLLLNLAGIPKRIGFANSKSGWLLTHRVPAAPPSTAEALKRAGRTQQPGESIAQHSRHKAATYLPLLAAVSRPATLTAYEYFVSEEERAEARARLSTPHCATGGPLIVLHPGANWFHKRWSAQRFAQLGDRLAGAHHAQVMITGGPADLALAGAVNKGMRQPATVMAGQTTLRQLGALLEQARLVVSNDTGVLHMAAALRRPVVALYGPTAPALTGPLGDPTRTIVVHHPDCCPEIPCFRPHRPPHVGMEAITVEEAYGAAATLLERPS